MSDYIIATSSTSDLPRTWLEEHNIDFEDVGCYSTESVDSVSYTQLTLPTILRV